MSDAGYHDPVLLKESVDQLIQDKNGVYVDVTFGGGGHSRKVLSVLGNEGKLIAFDQDEDAHKNSIDDERFVLVKANFRYLKNNLRFLGINRVDGILADLGVSSHQFDKADRGFSIRYDGRLDMRMGKTTTLTAEKVVNSYSLEDLTKILKEYGEINRSGRIAAELINLREENKFETTGQLVQALEKFFPVTKRKQGMAKIFQAIRIEVNDELKVLKEFLSQASEMLREGGKLVVISYHSLEDRLVKRYMKTGNFEGEVEKDFYGNLIRPLTPKAGMPITPSEEEIEKNKRARSAKMRVAEKQ